MQYGFEKLGFGPEVKFEVEVIETQKGKFRVEAARFIAGRYARSQGKDFRTFSQTSGSAIKRQGFTKGTSQREVNARMLALAVLCGSLQRQHIAAGYVNALNTACLKANCRRFNRALSSDVSRGVVQQRKERPSMRFPFAC